MNPARVLMAVIGWGLRLAPLPAFLFSCWVVFAETVAGTPFHRAMIWGLWGFAAALFATYGIFWLIEKISEWTEDYKDAKRVARLLRDSSDAGHRGIVLLALVDLWLEVQPENKAVRFAKRNYRLRLLKDAVEQGLLKADLLGDSFPSQRSIVDIPSAVQFFQKRRYHEVKPRQSGVVYSDERPAPRE